MALEPTRFCGDLASTPDLVCIRLDCKGQRETTDTLWPDVILLMGNGPIGHPLHQIGTCWVWQGLSCVCVCVFLSMVHCEDRVLTTTALFESKGLVLRWRLELGIR